jgi:nucleoside-diphosphate-sugar epimerase
MRYFLTGATGFLGGALARHLAAAGHHVTALVRDPAKAAALSSAGPPPASAPPDAAGIAFVKGDITDKESMRAPMTGVDGVFHCAAWYKVGVSAEETATAERTNVGGTRNVLELMRELRIPKGVYTSTVAIFSDTEGREPDESYYHAGPFLSEYDRTKWRAHYEVAVPMAREGLPLVILQPGVIYGPGDTSGVRAAFVQYLQGKLAGIPAKTAFSWAHVDDVADVHILAMEKGRPGESYIVAGPSHTMTEAFEMAREITGIAPPSFHPSPGLMKVAAAIMGVVGSVFPLSGQLSAESLRVLAGVTYMGSNAKARRELGYAPRPLKDGLRETLPHEMRLLGM